MGHCSVQSALPDAPPVATCPTVDFHVIYLDQFLHIAPLSFLYIY